MTPTEQHESEETTMTRQDMHLGAMLRRLGAAYGVIDIIDHTTGAPAP